MTTATLSELDLPEGGAAVSDAADGKLWGLLAQYADVDALLHAAEAVRDGGYRCWDCYTPYPVHGLDKAMGVKRTILPFLVLCGGLTGCMVAIGLQFYCNSPYTASAKLGLVSGYPMVFSGKPYWSLPANIPIIFELTVLFSALTTFFGLWALCQLPMPYFPACSIPRFRRVTDDGLFIIIEASDKAFDAAGCRQLLEATHCTALDEVYVEADAASKGSGAYGSNGHGQFGKGLLGNGHASTKPYNVGGHA
jgi:hypothetical protein